MRAVREWIHRLSGTLRPRRSDEELADELRLHLELAADEARRHSADPADATRAARLRLGGSTQAMEALRDQRGLPWLDDLLRDMRHGVRSLRRTPVFTCVALLTFALGVGATTAIFTLVRSVLLRPLPFSDPETLYVIAYASPGPAWLYPGMSDRGYLEFREANRTFESLATFSAVQSTLTGVGDATRIAGAAVTTDFFRVLGVNAALGRTFGPEDERTGSDSVLIADSLWRSQFGADPRLVDGTIVLNGMPYRVAGVLPPGFSYPADASYWIPLTVQINPNLGFIRPVIGRVKPAVTLAQAQADLEGWVRSLPPAPNRPRNLVAQVTRLHDAMVRDVRLPLLVFGGAVAFVLLIACANVANLLLIRAVSRRQEIAARLALGATRRRVARQFLTEGAMLSLAGGGLGAGVAFLGGPALLSLIPAGRLPADLAVRVDGWVLAFTAGLSVLTGLIAGLAPIAQTGRESLYGGPLRGGTASATRHSHRLRHALVIAEVALTLVLLIGAGLLVRSFINLSSVPLGFTPGRVLTMTVDLPVSRYPSVEQAAMLHSRLLQSLSATPGVESAAAVNWLPLGDMVLWGDVQAEDRPDLVGTYTATKVAISPDYFRTMGIGVLRGRPFTDEDRAGRLPVVIVSESVARRLWPGADPLGRRMALVDRPTPRDWRSVVGVVADVRQGGFRSDPTHAVYQPYEQVTNRSWVGYMTFLVRTAGDPVQAAPMMRAALARIDRDEAPQAVATLDAVIDRTVAEPQFQARVLASFSLVALLLAGIGIYGVLASSVLERRSEIGIRMALGADRTSVIRLIVVRMLVLTVVGLAIGLAGSLAVTDLLASLLFSVAPRDVATFAVAASVLVAAALAAAVIPARRAARMDPVQALRAE